VITSEGGQDDMSECWHRNEIRLSCGVVLIMRIVGCITDKN
jgi:hypothetical protein